MAAMLMSLFVDQTELPTIRGKQVLFGFVKSLNSLFLLRNRAIF